MSISPATTQSSPQIIYVNNPTHTTVTLTVDTLWDSLVPSSGCALSFKAEDINRLDISSSNWSVTSNSLTSTTAQLSINWQTSAAYSGPIYITEMISITSQSEVVFTQELILWVNVINLCT